MIIKYAHGRTMEAFLLSRQGSSMRVALPEADDTVEFVEMQGNWVGENLEPVEIAFEWQRQPDVPGARTDADFICPKNLAAHLIGLLGRDSREDEAPFLKCLVAGQNLM